jgi:hypothetical protein
MTGKGTILSALATLALASAAAPVSAVPVTWDFTSRVTSLSSFGTLPSYLTGVQNGDLLSWRVEIETAAPIAVGADFARYDVIRFWLLGSPIDLTLSIPDPSEPGASAGVDVSNDGLGGIFDSISLQAHARVGGDSSGFQIFHAGMFFTDLSATALDSLDLPLDPPDLAAFPLHTFTLEFQDNALSGFAFWRAEGDVSSATRVTAVPEPAVLWLLCAGLLVAVGATRYRALQRGGA